MNDRLPRPATRAEFRARLRAELLREAPAALAPAPRTFGWWRPLAGAVAMVALLVAANTAAAQSLPGEAPFMIKRTVEEGRLLLAFDKPARVEILADHAQQRLAEVQRATARVQPDAAADASSGLERALGRLANEVEQLRRATPPVDDGDQQQGERGLGRAEQVAREQAEAIEKLLPAAAAPTRISLERAVEQTRKIRATMPPRDR